MTTTPQTDPVFTEHRPALLGLAYRMLGSMADAEDVVQDTWLRWRSHREAVTYPRAFLIKVATRQALDLLGSARHRREAYVGPWLPEPVATGATDLGPDETAAQRDTLSLGTMRLLERLTPPERAVFILRQAFELPHDEIAQSLDLSPANVRQLHSRAQRRLDIGPRRFPADDAKRRDLLERFLRAADSGDREGLEALLASDVELWNDGGGQVTAARHVIVGLDRTVRFVVGVTHGRDVSPLRTLEVNHQPAILLHPDGIPSLVVLEGHSVQVHAIQIPRNPDKLRHILHHPTEGA